MIKRYDYDFEQESELVEDKNGEWVKWEDVKGYIHLANAWIELSEEITEIAGKLNANTTE